MNRTKLITLCLCLAIVFSACTTTQSGKISYDPEAKATIVTGNETTIAPLAGAVRTMFLKAEISPAETGLYLVVLYLSTDGWLSAHEIWDSSGTRLVGLRGSNEAVPIQFGQVTKEIYYIPLTRRYLEAHRKSGIDIYLKGASGTLTATQPSSFVNSFLVDLDSTENRLHGEVVVKQLIPTITKPKAPSGSRP
jgi:hypothetical protein